MVVVAKLAHVVRVSTHLGSLRLDFAGTGKRSVDFAHDCDLLVVG
jgi:hypothetical protein